jgi:hypothetical protein
MSVVGAAALFAVEALYKLLRPIDPRMAEVMVHIQMETPRQPIRGRAE